MKMKKSFVILVVLLFSLALSSCKEAADGADQIADEVTGKRQIETKVKIEKKLEAIQESNNKQNELLDKIKD